MPPKRVTVIGSGNFGSTVACLVGKNCAQSDEFETECRMWVFDEQVDVGGEMKSLVAHINEKHENVKYLPGVGLPENVVAVPDVVEACR
jgi:glycerol-3-phosphate dehydrogenase (NAD+)